MNKKQRENKTNKKPKYFLHSFHYFIHYVLRLGIFEFVEFLVPN